MGQRIASVAQEVLADSGIEVLGNVGGDESNGTVTLSDPNQSKAAARILRRMGVKAHRTGSLTMEVSAAQEEPEDEDDLSRMVAGWQEFHSHSQDSGYRKAARKISKSAKSALDGDTIMAAHQIAERTAELAEASGSDALAKLSAALRAAAISKDGKTISKLLGSLSASDRSPKPVMKSPNEMTEAYADDNEGFSGYQETGFSSPHQEQNTQNQQQGQSLQELQSGTSNTDTVQQTNPAPQKTKKRMSQKRKREKRLLMAFAQKLFSSAFSTIVRVARDKNLAPKEVMRIGMILEAEYDNWRRNLDASDADASDAWKQASQAVAMQLNEDQARSVSASRDDSGMTYIHEGYGDDFNEGFLIASTMNVPRTANQMVDLVEDIIEHYAAEIHPSDLDKDDIEGYLDEHSPETCPKKTMKTLKKVLDDGLPNRDGDRVDDTDE